MTDRWPIVVGWLLVLGGAVFLVFALLDRTDEPSRAVGPTGPTVTAPLRDFGEVAVRLTDRSGRTKKRCLLAARTERERARGLMQVTDRTLHGHDGMVFLFEQQQQSGFWMRNTPMPLSIAYFDSAGRVVSITDMKPCSDMPNCPSYPPTGPYTSAIEVPEGRLPALGIDRGSQLQVAGRCEANSS